MRITSDGQIVEIRERVHGPSKLQLPGAKEASQGVQNLDIDEVRRM